MGQVGSIKLPALILVAALAPALWAHETITTRLSWSKEVSRVVLRRCGGCHGKDTVAFPLTRYEEVRPWAKAIQEEVLRRRMPPTNAVKGFGELRHDLALSGEEIHLIADWVEGGAPEGDPNLLPAGLKPNPLPGKIAGGRLPFRDRLRLAAPLTLAGVEIAGVAEGQSFQLVAELSGGERLPLLWILQYSRKAQQSYEFAEPLRLPAGTQIVAYPPAQGIGLRLITGSLRRR